MCDNNDLLDDNNYGPADDDLTDDEAICANCGEVVTECTCDAIDDESEEVCPNCGEALADCNCGNSDDEDEV